MTVPLHWGRGNVPIGSHFTAPLGAEATLLELAYQLEAARPWADRWPPFSAVRLSGG
jgi:Asp-tRNA(Asn)/Glu-tRNA(Gln) amidotransferase A subunit family amidase